MGPKATIASLLAAAAIAFVPMPALACAATTLGSAVAMQLDGENPFVIGRDGVVARFESSMANTQTVRPPVHAPRLFCTGVSDVVAIAAGRGILRVADRSRVFAFDERNGKRLRTFAPTLAPNEAIAAIASLPSGGLEVAIVTAHAARFAAFEPSVRGEHALPVRNFTYANLLGRPSAITIDTKARVYAYDDGGEVLVFAARSSGEVKPVRRFVGTESALRPAARGNTGGSRQMALDALGSLYVADDGAIVILPFSNDGQLSQGDITMVDPDAHLGIVRGIATGGESIDLYVLSVDPVSARAVIKVYPAYGVNLPFDIPVP